MYFHGLSFCTETNISDGGKPRNITEESQELHKTVTNMNRPNHSTVFLDLRSPNVRCGMNVRGFIRLTNMNCPNHCTVFLNLRSPNNVRCGMNVRGFHSPRPRLSCYRLSYHCIIRTKLQYAVPADDIHKCESETVNRVRHITTGKREQSKYELVGGIMQKIAGSTSSVGIF